MTFDPSTLVDSTKQVFDECSSVYLREDKHWGCDLDIISECIEREDSPRVIELGTGYAWHLGNIYFTCSTKLRRVVGVDYSPKMIDQARSFLSSIRIQDEPLSNVVELFQDDIQSLSFPDGSFDVALLLNNTLGNIASKDFVEARSNRRTVLSECCRVLAPSKRLVISVYNAARLTEEDRYGLVFELDPNLSKLETFDLVVRFKATGTPYYSHWFSDDEIRQLLYESGFLIESLEHRRKRIVVVARKK